MDLETTIVAISSAPGRSNKALLRISGKCALQGARDLGLSPTFGSVCCDSVMVENRRLPVLVAAFPRDASYTSDDLVEIQFPGNPILASRLLTLFVHATGGREAIAGEFTARAFFSGRISLAQAEGVSATISASNNAELLGATLLREGVLAKLTEPITTGLTRTLALIEAGIDFTDEEDVEAISQQKLTDELKLASRSIQSILTNSVPMVSLRSLPRVVIAGEPNAGKSTLFNAIIGEKRVVVHCSSGTTRDAVEEQVSFQSIETMLVDIAGLQQTSDDIGRSSQIVARDAIESADLVLWCVAPGQKNPAPDGRTFIVHTKSDLTSSTHDAICAITGEGIESLTKRVANHLQSTVQSNVEAVAILPRHEQHLQHAMDAVHDAEETSHVAELCAACLRDSIEALGQLTGRITPDDVLEHVFSSFCVGK